jgi:asparagine synthase (glutamine-hydrolysing)
MLDDRFISIATALEPRDKRSSRFLSRLQLELDSELGRLPLEGRPAPAAYARRTLPNSARQTSATLGKARRKVAQRVHRANRPPAGGEVLAARVVSHWRDEPATLERLVPLAVFREDWLEAVVKGEAVPPPSAVALMVNLLAATEPA